MFSASTSIALPSSLRHGLLLALACSIMLAGSASASTPVPQVAPYYDAVSCSLSPLTLPLFDGTPPAALATPAAATPDVAAAQKPTAEEASDIQSAVATIVACINTGNPRLVYAVFSEHYLATEYADPTKAYLPAFEQQLDGPTIPVDPPFVFVSVTRILMLAPDRVEATVAVSQMQYAWTTTLALVLVNGDWLIDEVIQAPDQ